jgi:hypothetical protein
MRAAKRKDRKAFKIKLARGVEMKAANVALLAKWKSGVGRSIYDQIAAPKFWGSLLDGMDQPYKHIQDTRLPVPSAPENAKWEHNQRDAYVHDMYPPPTDIATILASRVLLGRVRLYELFTNDLVAEEACISACKGFAQRQQTRAFSGPSLVSYKGGGFQSFFQQLTDESGYPFGGAELQELRLTIRLLQEPWAIEYCENYSPFNTSWEKFRNFSPQLESSPVPEINGLLQKLRTEIPMVPNRLPKLPTDWSDLAKSIGRPEMTREQATWFIALNSTYLLARNFLEAVDSHIISIGLRVQIEPHLLPY